MNKTSVVIDGHTVTYWKYQLIHKLYKENNLNKIYITNHKNFYRAFSFFRFFYMFGSGKTVFRSLRRPCETSDGDLHCGCLNLLKSQLAT